MAEEQSVYQRVLGDRFDMLDPQLQSYFGPLPRDRVGVGRGTYDVAGSRWRIFRPVLAWLAWRHVLFPEYGRRVPFTVANDSDASGTLSARREFHFPRRVRVMEDTMTVRDGVLVDRLGKRRGLEVDLQLSVRGGGLRMTSTRLGLRIAGRRVPLPRVVSVSLSERSDPVHPGRQLVDVVLAAPLLGEVFRYAGSFTYRLETKPRRGIPSDAQG